MGGDLGKICLFLAIRGESGIMLGWEVVAAEIRICL